MLKNVEIVGSVVFFITYSTNTNDTLEQVTIKQ